MGRSLVPAFWERLEIRLDKNLNRLFAGINRDTNRRIAKVHLVASSVLSSNDGVGHYRLALRASLKTQSRPKPRGGSVCFKLRTDGARAEPRRWSVRRRS